jgi:hypothetical protein
MFITSTAALEVEIFPFNLSESPVVNDYVKNASPRRKTIN